jgi:hypothetical protein
MLDPKSLAPGEEQHERFQVPTRRNRFAYQYDYRNTDGELFSCARSTLKECRALRDQWIERYSIV